MSKITIELENLSDTQKHALLLRLQNFLEQLSADIPACKDATLCEEVHSSGATPITSMSTNRLVTQINYPVREGGDLDDNGWGNVQQAGLYLAPESFPKDEAEQIRALHAIWEQTADAGKDGERALAYYQALVAAGFTATPHLEINLNPEWLIGAPASLIPAVTTAGLNTYGEPVFNEEPQQEFDDLDLRRAILFFAGSEIDDVQVKTDWSGDAHTVLSVKLNNNCTGLSARTLLITEHITREHDMDWQAHDVALPDLEFYDEATQDRLDESEALDQAWPPGVPLVNDWGRRLSWTTAETTT